MTGNRPVRSVAICCWGLMISEKIWLERVSNVSIGSSSVGGVSGFLVGLMFLHVCFMYPFAMYMELGRWLIRSTVRLGHVLKWPLLMARSKVLRTGLKSVAWYQLASSGFLLDTRALSTAGCCWLGGWSVFLVRSTRKITDVFDQMPSSTFISSLDTLRWVAAKVAMHP